MMRFGVTLAAAASMAALGGCVTTAPAPGAGQVKITHTAADVSGCTPAGNIKVPRGANGLVDIASAETQFRNAAVGLGGNVAFVTEGALGVPTAGIAYRCP